MSRNAQAAGLQVENGIRVDGSLRTNERDIHAAGDVASFHNPALNQWLRVQHEDNAITMGKPCRCAAMAGRSVAYDHLPFFYSDLFEMGYEAVGEVDARLRFLRIGAVEGGSDLLSVREGRVRRALVEYF